MVRAREGWGVPGKVGEDQGEEERAREDWRGIGRAENGQGGLDSTGNVQGGL